MALGTTCLDLTGPPVGVSSPPRNGAALADAGATGQTALWPTMRCLHTPGRGASGSGRAVALRRAPRRRSTAPVGAAPALRYRAGWSARPECSERRRPGPERVLRQRVQELPALVRRGETPQAERPQVLRPVARLPVPMRSPRSVLPSVRRRGLRRLRVRQPLRARVRRLPEPEPGRPGVGRPEVLGPEPLPAPSAVRQRVLPARRLGVLPELQPQLREAVLPPVLPPAVQPRCRPPASRRSREPPPVRQVQPRERPPEQRPVRPPGQQQVQPPEQRRAQRQVQRREQRPVREQGRQQVRPPAPPARQAVQGLPEPQQGQPEPPRVRRPGPMRYRSPARRPPAWRRPEPRPESRPERGLPRAQQPVPRRAQQPPVGQRPAPRSPGSHYPAPRAESPAMR